MPSLNGSMNFFPGSVRRLKIYCSDNRRRKRRHENEYNLPPDKMEALERVRRLEYWSVFFLLTIILALGFTMGSSQAMKAMWTEDFLSLVPTLGVIIGIHFRR